MWHRAEKYIWKENFEATPEAAIKRSTWLIGALWLKTLFLKVFFFKGPLFDFGGEFSFIQTNVGVLDHTAVCNIRPCGGMHGKPLYLYMDHSTKIH